MKRSALQCVAGFVGATLIVVGVVWTCRQLSAPTQLNAAQETQEGGLARFSLPQRESAKPAAANTKKLASKTQANQSPRKIRPVSTTSELSLSLLDSEPKTDSVSPEIPEPIAPSQNLSVEPASPLADEFPAPMADELQSSEMNDPFPTTDRLVPDPMEEDLSEDPFPSVPSAPLESPLDDAQVAPAPIQEQRPSPAPVAGSSLSLKEIEDDLPQSEPAEALVPANPQRNPLSVADEENGAIASPLADPLSASNLSEEAPQTIPSKQIPSIASEPQRLDEPSFQGGNKAVASYVNSVVSRQATPADSELEGAQTLEIVVEKLAPEEVQTGKSATITIKVKNNGKKTARRLLLHDVVPQGSQFVSADQNVTPSAQGDLFWPAFDLESQREKKFEYTVIPSAEGDFGSVATVLLPIEASCKIKSSRPELKVEATAPETVELGENVNFEIIVTNVGTGVAYNVALLETIPEGLYHPSGAVLDNKLGSLKAGESKRLPLTLKTVAQGDCVNKLSVSADDCEPYEVETVVHVAAPQLELGIKGVTNAYLEQSSVYKLSIRNNGDASARNVKLIAQLPESVSFVKANNLGAYKEDEHSVYWDLAELPAQTDCEVELTIKSTKPDNVELVFSATGPNDLSVQTSKTISIDGLAALSFNVSSSADLIEAGKEFEYTVAIVNNGTKASSNIVLQILAPEAISILATDGPTQATNRNGVVVFDKVPEIGPKSTATFKIKAVANQAGDCRVGFQLSSDDLDPLVKETNTRVYE